MHNSIFITDKCMGNSVIVKPKRSGDNFKYEFIGTIVGIKDSSLKVEDSNKKCFIVDICQVTFI